MNMINIIKYNLNIIKYNLRETKIHNTIRLYFIETKSYRVYAFFRLFFSSCLTSRYFNKKYQFKRAFKLSRKIWLNFI